jgi:hypothetical protein
MFAQPDAHIRNACRTLFGPETAVSHEFLHSLKPNLLKTVFRKKAMETHPDFFTRHDPVLQRKQTELFQVVNKAYEIMRGYCERRDRERARNYVQRPAAPRTPASTRPTPLLTDNAWIFRGTVPERRLEIGRYLYYRGRIPYQELLLSLQWQMRQRPSIGAIAKQWGWLDDRTIHTILSYRGMPRLFCQRALQLGILTSYQVRILLAHQRKLQQKLGQYFVDHCLLSYQEMEQMVSDLDRHNMRFPFSSVADWRRT